jgi:hypothetical protein
VTTAGGGTATANYFADLAFQNPDGEIIVIVRNGGTARENIALTVEGYGGKMAQLSIPANAYTTYRFYLPDGVADVTAKTYGIDVSEAGLVDFGYDEEASQVVTVANAGNQRPGAFHISLSGGADSKFELSRDTIYGLEVEGQSGTRGFNVTSVEFTVGPKKGLVPGVYTETVTIGGNPNVADKTFEVRFEVFAADSLRIAQNKVQAPAMMTVQRNTTYQFDLILTPTYATTVGLTWSVNNTSLATVTADGFVTIRGMTGNVTLTARALGGATHSIVLRIT